jgi:4-hydroxybenzoate polyprenyltransferase
MTEAIPVKSKLQNFSKLVVLSHSIFALPFAASAVAIARRGPHLALTWQRALLMLVCMVSARSAAMAWNRYADRDIDAKNPRTKVREIPSGAVSPKEALTLTIVCCMVFLAAAAALGFWPAVLAPLVLVVLLGYSQAKRFTALAHLWLGVALALAPGGAWIAMGVAPNAGILWLMGGVVTWLFGFDILYSLQDEQFDRDNGLHSIPAKFGMAWSLVISAGAHLLTIGCFLAAGLVFGLRYPYFIGFGLVTVLLVYEHALIGKGDLSKINKAFFDVNAYIGVVFFLCTLTATLI